MPFQTYLVQPENTDDQHARESIAEFIARRQGLVLMATARGALIVAFDDQHLDAVKAHDRVRFVGPVTLDPQRPGAEKLQRLFARNAALQLASRGMIRPETLANAADGRSQSPASPLPPGYRPSRWPDPGEGGDGSMP